jgi:hypothetical protein
MQANTRFASTTCPKEQSIIMKQITAKRRSIKRGVDTLVLLVLTYAMIFFGRRPLLRWEEEL